MKTVGRSSLAAYPHQLEAEAEVVGNVAMTLFWARISRRKWLIAVASIVLFGAFATVLFSLPKAYTTEAEVIVEHRPQSVDLAAVLSRLPTDNQAVQTEAEALRSRTLVRRVILDYGLMATPEFNPRIIPQDGSLRSQWRTAKATLMDYIDTLLPGPARPSTGDPALNTATDIFLKHLQVKPVGRSQVLRATFTSEDPELSSKLLNRLVSLYLASQMDNRVAVPNKVGDYLKVELERLQDKVRQANDAVERYRNQAQLQQGIFQSREAPLNTTALSQANSDLVAVRVKLQEANARLNEIRNNPDAFSDVIANPGIQQLRHQLSLVKENRSQLLATYGRANPAVRQVEASVADVERRLNVEIGRVVRSFASDVVVLTEREAKLVKTVDALKAEIQKAGNSRVVLASLEQEAEVNRTILTTFLTQYNQLTSQRALQVSDSFVLTKADVPTDPSFPPVVPFLGLAALMSVALSTGLALLLERTGHTIRSSQEVQPLLTSRLLGVIPNLVNRNAVLTQVIDRPQSAFTEAIRTILSGILPARDQGRSVLVASAQPSEGRTSIAVALARLAALSGRRVILIDCDVRRPGLHDAFGSERGPGVTDVLRGEVTLEEAIRRDTLSPLHYLTGGDFAPSAANLLYLPEMSGLLDRLRSEYDLLILDSPPSACVADAGFLAQMADETLFVVSWNRTPWRLVRQQIAEFSRYNLDVAGVVLNQVDMRLHSRQSPAYLATYRARAMLEAAE